MGVSSIDAPISILFRQKKEDIAKYAMSSFVEAIGEVFVR
jgi:hypothetical protein